MQEEPNSAQPPPIAIGPGQQTPFSHAVGFRICLYRLSFSHFSFIPCGVIDVVLHRVWHVHPHRGTALCHAYLNELRELHDYFAESVASRQRATQISAKDPQATKGPWRYEN